MAETKTKALAGAQGGTFLETFEMSGSLPLATVDFVDSLWPVSASKRARVVDLIGESFGSDRIRVLDRAQGWPSRCEIWDGTDWRAALLYVGSIGHSGRGRPDELRMQNAGDRSAIAAPHEGEAVLLLGVWSSEESPEVFVAWEARRRFGRQTRFSLFVPLETVLSATRVGSETTLNASGERILAFTARAKESLRAAITSSENGTMQDTELEMPEDDASDAESDLETLAEKLALLSEGETPTEFSRPPMGFEPTDVDWSTNDWLARVFEVQEWLHLDAPVELERGAESALAALFADVEHPTACFAIEAGFARLTDAGIAALGARLDIAITLKQEFTEAVDSGRANKDATASWVEAWEESSVVVDDPPEDVHAKVDTWNISSFKDRAKVGGIELNPTYQRDNVWSDKESSELIDSIMRGIPLPSIILNQRKGDDSLEIVDGKQRLTAILRFIGYHPEALKFADQVEKEFSHIKSSQFHSDYSKWKSAVKKHRGLTGDDERENFLPFKYSIPRSSRDKGPLRAFGGKYYSDIQKDSKAEVMIQGRPESVRKVFELPMSSYKLSVILYEDTDIHQIHKVFGLYNRQGKKLNATEVRNAIYHHLTIAKLLLLLSGDNRNADALAPYLLKHDFDTNRIPDLLKSMSVSDGRFNRTKLTSWVAAILVHRLDTKAGQLGWPGSTSFIEGMMRSIADSKTHPLTSNKACEHLALALHGGATLLEELRAMEAFWPKFTHPQQGGEKWEELPAVAAWTACTLGAIAGVEATTELREAVLATTKRVERLKKQQARTQWGYMAGVTLDLLTAMRVDTDTLGATLEKRFGYNCIPALVARRT